MKVKTLSALAGLGATMILSTAAQADLVANTGVNTSLSVVEVASGGGTPPVGGPRTIYHVYANFTAGADRVLTWGIGGVNFGPGGINNLNAAGSGPGLGFTNVGAAGAGTPSSPGSTRDWDTYATLGVRYLSQLPAGADAPAYSPGFPAFITGTSLVVPASGMATFITPDPVNTHGQADFINSGSDDATRVLLMQLVVNTGDHVEGTIGLVWDTTGAGGVVASGLSFTTVPAPGALALLGLAGLVGSRRRRA
jgi:MYXO-CTERM domain-containing protein